MKKSPPKRGRGQPQKYRSPTVAVCVTLPRDLIDSLDAEVAARRADGAKCNRSTLIVELISAAIAIPGERGASAPRGRTRDTSGG